MLGRIIKCFEESDKDRASLDKYIRNLHEYIMDMKNIQDILRNSIAEEIVVDKEKCYIKLNEDYHNIKMIINNADVTSNPMSILGTGTYEKRETKTVLNVIKKLYENKGMCVLDIGANEGWYTLNIKKMLKNVAVYSFEPSPITFRRLKENLLLNDENVNNVVNIGLYDRNSTLGFYYNEESSGASSFVNIREKEEIKPIEVNVRRLDDWARENEITKVDFIKCDVEGAELFVYKGGREVIERSKPIVFSEMLRKWSAKFGYTPNDIISFFKELGYKCYVIESETGLKECPKVTEATVETNYFFLHEMKHAQIIEEMVL